MKSFLKKYFFVYFLAGQGVYTVHFVFLRDVHGFEPGEMLKRTGALTTQPPISLNQPPISLTYSLRLDRGIFLRLKINVTILSLNVPYVKKTFCSTIDGLICRSHSRYILIRDLRSPFLYSHSLMQNFQSAHYLFAALPAAPAAVLPQPPISLTWPPISLTQPPISLTQPPISVP